MGTTFHSDYEIDWAAIMKIVSSSLENTSTNWVLEEVTFQNLTLLVGASGVGKTRILKGILDLKRIVLGKSIGGLVWSIQFQTKDGKQVSWEGAFEDLGFIPENLFVPYEELDDDSKPNIIHERLIIDGGSVVDRNQKELLFNGTPTVKLSLKESVLSLLKEEPQIKELFLAFGRILFDDNTTPSASFIIHSGEDQTRNSKPISIESIREGNEPIPIKLHKLYQN